MTTLYCKRLQEGTLSISERDGVITFAYCCYRGEYPEVYKTSVGNTEYVKSALSRFAARDPVIDRDTYSAYVVLSEETLNMVRLQRIDIPDYVAGSRSAPSINPRIDAAMREPKSYCDYGDGMIIAVPRGGDSRQMVALVDGQLFGTRLESCQQARDVAARLMSHEWPMTSIDVCNNRYCADRRFTITWLCPWRLSVTLSPIV